MSIDPTRSGEGTNSSSSKTSEASESARAQKRLGASLTEGAAGRGEGACHTRERRVLTAGAGAEEQGTGVDGGDMAGEARSPLESPPSESEREPILSGCSPWVKVLDKG